MAGPVRPAYRIYQGLWAGLDLLFPPICGGCGGRGSRWCAQCQASVRTIQPPICNLCGNSLDRAGICDHCLTSPPRFTAVRSWAIFEGSIRQAVHRLKYGRDVSLGEILSRPLLQMLNDLNWGVDLVIPVPLGLARLKERGYNQAVLLARPLAMGSDKVYRSQALVRSRETRSQVGLSFSQRRENVTGAFRAIPKWVDGRRVLVIDDVATSSATLDACAEALLIAGAKVVYGLTLARAGRKDIGSVSF